MIKINKNIIFSKKKPPIIIAEISGNHNGNKKKFLKLIEAACHSGADLIKIQTYEPKDITIKSRQKNFKITKGIWKNKYLWDIYNKAHTPYDWHSDAFKLVKKYNKVLFSSPFSKRGVDLLESLKVKLYKIASYEITDLSLIKYVASKKKPIIISTGTASILEIKSAIEVIKKYHKKIIILHCVSDYPTKLENSNLYRINILKKVFKNYMIGLSDHTDDIYSSIAAIPLGIVAIEKHFKLDTIKTIDSKFSIKPNELRDLKKITLNLHLSLKKKKLLPNQNFKLRRSIFTTKEIRKNQKISEKNIDCYRPEIGIKANNFYKILGRRVKKNIKKNQPLYFGMLKN